MQRLFKTLILTPLTLVLVASLYVGCGALIGNPDDEDDEPKKEEEIKKIATGMDGKLEGQGTIQFSITDAPIDDVKHVYVRIIKLEISKVGEAWIDIPLAVPNEIDLLSLQNGTTDALAALSNLNAGEYKQVRLILDEKSPGSIVLDSGTTHDLKIPSGSQTGLKLHSSFVIKDGETLDLTIDFDLRKSLTMTRQANTERYLLKPVLRLIEDNKSGIIKGYSLDADVVCAYFKGVTKDDSSSCGRAENSAIVKDGNYTIAFLEEGEYQLRLFPSEGDYKDLSKTFIVVGGETNSIDE